MTVVERIIDLLSKKEVSASKMMKDLGFSSGLFSQWKSGMQNPSNDKVQKIANYFNVTTDYLLGNTDSPDNTFVYDEDDNLVVIDDDTRELIDSLRTRPEMKILFSVSKKATKEDIEQAVKIIEALRKNENEE